MALQSKKLKRSLHTNNLLIQFSFSDSKHKPFGLTKTKAPRKYLTSQAYFASSNPAPAQARISLWLYLPRFSEYTFCFRMLHMRAHNFFSSFILRSRCLSFLLSAMNPLKLRLPLSSTLMISLDDRPGFTIDANTNAEMEHTQLIYG